MRRFSILAIAGTVALTLIAMYPTVASAASGIVALSPQPKERITTATPAIAAQIEGVAALDGAVHVTVDGRDVSDAVTIAGDRVTYKPSKPLGAGLHAVQIDVDDGSGSRLMYQWSFTVEGDATNSTDAAARSAQPAAPGDDSQSAAPNLAPAYDAADIPSYPPLNAALGDSGPPFGYPNFGFYPVTGSQFYWGQNVPFVFNGAPGGNGFVTFGGIPGFFNLVPGGYNTYYVTVPIPVGYRPTNPPIVCHFFAPNGSPVVVPLRRSIAIVARRAPQTMRTVATVMRAPTVQRTVSPATYRAALAARGGGAWRTMAPVRYAARPALRNSGYLPSCAKPTPL